MIRRPWLRFALGPYAVPAIPPPEWLDKLILARPDDQTLWFRVDASADTFRIELAPGVLWRQLRRDGVHGATGCRILSTAWSRRSDAHGGSARRTCGARRTEP